VAAKRLEIDGVPYTDSAGACELLGVKRETLYAYVSRGRLRSFKRGGRARIYALADIDALLRLEAGSPTKLPAVEDWMPYID
jgi:citrate synthase